MARAPKTTAAATESSNALIPWQEQLAKDAAIAADMEANAGGGNFFSVRGGILSFNDAPLKNNEMAVVITDAILENVFYDGVYDSSTPQAPLCFAFGRDEMAMKPHDNVVKNGSEQFDKCRGCPMNEFGTANAGKGKACRNTRRLAMISAGEFDEQGRFKMVKEADHFESAALGFMKLPVTSIKGYAAFVKQVVGVLGRPPHGIFTKVKVIPDPKTQFRVIFEALGPIPDHIMPAVMKRNQEARATIEQPYNLEVEAPAAPAGKGRNAAPKRPEVKKRKY
jgi:hypothetical protein